jgi:hypothetical protein
VPRIADEITNAYEDPGPWMIWLYGAWGCGKTVLGAQFPNALIIDTETSGRSLLNHPELATVPVIDCKNFDKFKKIVDGIILNQDEGFKSRETIIVDTFSTLQMRELNEQMKTVGQKQGRHPDLPSEGEFNINNTRLRKVVLDLLDRSGKNIVLLSHIKEEKDDSGNTLIIRPGNSPSISGTIANLCSGIFYMTSKTDSKGETTRKLKCMGTPSIWAKNRFAPLEKEIDDPEAKDVMKAIDEQRELVRQYLEENKLKVSEQTNA